MAADKTVSPKTCQTKKMELENWIIQEKEDLKSTKKDLKKGMKKALDSIKRFFFFIYFTELKEIFNLLKNLIKITI
jgi:hypothetical protein